MKNQFFDFLNIVQNSSRNFFLNRNMNILISNLLPESIFDYSKKKFDEFRSIFKKSQKMHFPLYFQKVIRSGEGFIFDKKIFCKSQTP